MSAADYEAIDDRRYRSDRSDRSHRHRDRRDEPRYVETQEVYTRVPAAPEAPYAVRQTTTDVVRRPVHTDSDLSVEEVARDFPPPGAGAYVQQRTMIRDDRYRGPPVRSRSAERGMAYGAYGGDPRRSYNDLDDRRSRQSALYVEQEVKQESRRRSLSRNEKIIAGVAGAALAVGGKELWDHRQADGRPVTRNPLHTAAIGAAGALVGYEGADLYNQKFAKGGEEKVKTYVAHRGRDGKIAEAYYSSEEDEKPKKISRRKSLVDQALALTGLGAAAKAVGSSRSRRGSDESRDTRARSHGGRSERGKSPEGAAKYQQAAKAALLAGATEAFRVRKEPGGLAGNSKRILTAAISAGGIDAAADRDPDRHSKRHILEAVVGGLAANYAVNGSRKDIEDDDGKSARGSRSRSRSRSKGPGGGSSGGPLAALATAGLGALAAKKLTDRSRSRSKAGSRRRRDSRDSYDSRSPSPRGGDRHKRSKSVTDYARKGLAALGIGGAAGALAHENRDRSRSRGDVEYEETHSRRSHRSDRDRSRSRGPDDGYRSSRHGDSGRDGNFDTRDGVYDDPRYADSRASNVDSRSGGGRSGRARDGRKNKRIAEGKQSESDSDLGSSTDDEKRIKKMKGKQFLTAGLATVATIHAAHSVYQSMEKREARKKAVQDGEMSPEEARKLKAKATLQDAASIGIAALGIKGAISEIKEANEMRHECKEFREKKEERHNKRLERQKKIPRDKDGKNEGRRRSSGSQSQRAPPMGRPYDDYELPRFGDGNPYATTLPPPPVGYYDDRR